MAQQNINYGTVPNDGTGDVYRVAIIKIQNNFTDLYTNKVDKAVTIALSGGATGTATALAGATVVIPITGLNMGSATAGTLAVARGGTGVTTSTGTGANVQAVSPALTGTPTVPTAARGDNSTKAASTAYVDQAGLSYYSNGTGLTSNTTLTAASVGKWFEVQTAGITVSLPVAGVPVGGTYTFKALQAFTLDAGTGNINPSIGAALATLSMPKGSLVTLAANSATGSWYVVNQYTNPTDMALAGVPTAPTAATATSTAQVATTAFVQAVNSADTGGSATAVALKTGRNFSVAGGATAAAQPFNGTADVVLTVTGLDVSKATAGTLAVARGGTGVTTSTGTGSAVLSASPVLTGTPTVPTAAAGTNTTQAASMAAVQAAVSGGFSKAITGGAVTLTEAEASNVSIYFTGVLTSNAVITFPASAKRWVVANNTTGSFTLTLKGIAARTEILTQGERKAYFVDAANNLYKEDLSVLPVTEGGTGVTTSTGTGSNVLSNSPTLTGAPLTPTATDGTSTTQVASTAFVQGAVGGSLSKAVTGGTVTLTATEASNALITLTGALTSNLSLVFPAGVRRLWTVSNTTTGAFTATAKLATGTGAVCTQGKRNLVTTDGTNFYDALTDFQDVALTGAPTSVTPTAQDRTTKIATTEFVHANRDLGAKMVVIDNAPPPTLGGLWMTQTSGNTSLNPDADWWSILRTQHPGYPSGYWQELALPFVDGGKPHFRQNIGGTKYAWKSLALFSDVTGKISGDGANAAGFINHGSTPYMYHNGQAKVYELAACNTPFNQRFQNCVEATVGFRSIIAQGINSTGLRISGSTPDGPYAYAQVIGTENLDNHTISAYLRPGVESFWQIGVGAGTFRMNNSGVGQSSGGWSATSDNRVKYQVRKIESALDKLSQLSGYTYIRQDMADMAGNMPVRSGVIAQEVLKVLPSTVNVPADYDPVNNYGGLLSVSMDGLVGLLINGLNELNAKFEEYKASHP